MRKDLLQPLSGFRDNANPIKDWVVEVIRGTYSSYGYMPFESPSLERQEILLGKLGQESQKQLYLFKDQGDRPVGLRYDLTVSLARYVAGNFNSLSFPFKRYEIGNVWRAERAQKGRLRQFTQADIDIVGVDSLAAESELLEVISTINSKLSLSMTCLINDRRLVDELIKKIGIPEAKRNTFLQIIDKASKITEEQLDNELVKMVLSDRQIKQARLIFLSEEKIDAGELGVDEKLLSNLDNLVKQSKSLGLEAKISTGMVRGLDYYTGTIFELVTEDYPSSLCGGGRYDSLIKDLGGGSIGAVGVSFGVDRLVELLTERKRNIDSPIFIACLPETEEGTRVWAKELRERGENVEVYLDASAPLAKQLKYAASRYGQVILPFQSEWKAGQVVVRDLETGQQGLVERENI